MMTISELARSGGVGVETVRYYQRRGLLAAPDRTGRAGIRHYGTAEVERLCFIRSAQQAGFTLTQIAELLELDSGRDRKRVREMASARIAALDEEIQRLQQSRTALAALATECGRGDVGPCPIIRAFEKAG